MTVCIAGICEEEGAPYIVLCADSKLDMGFLGSNEAARKVRILGRGWSILLAGDWNMAVSFYEHVRARFLTLPEPKNQDEAYQSINAACEGFTTSPFCVSDKQCAFLVTGFVGGRPIIFTLTLENSIIRLSREGDFAAVGIGEYVAKTILNIRGYKRSHGLTVAIYNIYEAKRLSEGVSGVGRSTTIGFHALVSAHPKDQDRTLWAVFNNKGMDFLEAMYKQLSLQSLEGLRSEAFPLDFFHFAEVSKANTSSNDQI